MKDRTEVVEAKEFASTESACIPTVGVTLTFLSSPDGTVHLSLFFLRLLDLCVLPSVYPIGQPKTRNLHLFVPTKSAEFRLNVRVACLICSLLKLSFASIQGATGD